MLRKCNRRTIIILSLLLLCFLVLTLSKSRGRYWLHAVFGIETTKTEPKANSSNRYGHETLGFFCKQWDDMNLDAWWTHRPVHFPVIQNTTHQCFRRGQSGSNRTKFATMAYRNQFDTSCSDLFVRYMWSSGWGADMANLEDGLVQAIKVGQPLVYTFDPSARQWWHYAAVKQTGKHQTCPTKGPECYFLPISACNVSSKESRINLRRNYEWGRYYSVYKYAYEFLTRGQQWLRREVAEWVDANKPQNFPIDEECAVLHVRRGDSVLQRNGYDRSYHTIDEYLTVLAQNYTGTVPIQNILLLTDDAYAVDEAVALHPNLNWHSFNRTRWRGPEGGFAHHTVAATPRDDAVIILGTIEMAKLCNVFVHGYSSFAEVIKGQMQIASVERGERFEAYELKEKNMTFEERKETALYVRERLANLTGRDWNGRKRRLWRNREHVLLSL